MDRKTFIRNAALTTAGGLVLGSGACANGGAGKKVIIIGAGFAGLAAAYKLAGEVDSVVVLEARNRIGGRVFSHVIDEQEKLVVELGAEWVGDSHHRVQELCREFDLETFENRFETNLIYKGKYYDKMSWGYSEEWMLQFERLKAYYKSLKDDSPEAKELDKTDWWRYLVNSGCGGDDLVFRELLDSTDFGESNRHVSAYFALGEYAGSNDTNEMDRKIRGGNGKLAEALRDRIGAEHILLNKAVSRIGQQGKGKVTVTCSDKTEYYGTHVICTAPTFCVKKIKWQPELPAETMTALNALQYGRITKNASLYSNRFWNDEKFDMITDSPGHYFYHGTKDQPSEKGVLISYSIGDKSPAVSAQTDPVKADLIDLCLRPAFGDTKQFLEKQVNYNWGEDKYSRGAYAMYGTGQWFDVFPKLKAPFENTHFAGEHLSEEWGGFMEGAIETGEAAAEAVLKDIL